MLGDDVPAAVANYRKASLMSQGIATDSIIVRGDKDELYPSALEKTRAAAQYIEFRALYIAVKNAESFNLVDFHKERHA